MSKKKQSLLISEEGEATLQVPETTEIFGALSKYLQLEDDDGNERYFLDSGNYGLNYIISGVLSGGYSSGLVTELYGLPSTGKTLLMMVAAAKMQQSGGIVYVNDVERRWNWEWATKQGLDKRLVIIKSPKTVEDWTGETTDFLEDLLKLNPIPRVLFILDSAATLSTYWEMESQAVKEDQGKRAKRIKAAMRYLPKELPPNAILLVANHIMDNPQIQYGPKTTTPGGRGVPFQASVRLELSKPIDIPDPEGRDRPIGETLRAICTKSSVCAPHGQVGINVYFSGKFSRYSGLVDIMLDLGIITNAGGWYSWKEKKFRAGDIECFCQENPAILEDTRWEHPYFLEN